MTRAFVVLAIATAACGGASQTAPVETLAIPPTVTSSGPPVIATAPSRQSDLPPVDPELAKWEGVWFDPATAYKTRMTIKLVGGAPTVVHVEEPIGDKEIYEIRASRFSAGTLEWSHYVPSTKYTVTYACSEVYADKLVCKWQNDHNASGDQELLRVGAGADDGD